MNTFLKKNAVTIIILLATIVLAGIAIFTAVRLYQLRQQPVAPNEPGSSPAAASIIEQSPKSGKWNYPEAFVIKNNSNQNITVRYHLDCWDETICGDKEEQSAFTLAPNETIEKGLGSICSKWQLDLNWTGGAGWDWGGVAEKSPDCGVSSPTPTASGTPLGSASPTPTGSASPSPTGSPIECSLAFSFSLTTSSPTPTGSASPTPTGSATPTATPTEPPRGGGSPTPSPTTSATPKASLTPTPGIGGADTSPTPASLPAAGATLPTILGIGAGFMLLLGAILLAL